jgi:hypothetical protein
MIRTPPSKLKTQMFAIHPSAAFELDFGGLLKTDDGR